MSSFAYQATEEDVEIVLRKHSLAVANTQGNSFESMANEVFGSLDLGLIEKAALMGNDLDVQTEYANDEIARQLREAGVLEPLTRSQPGVEFSLADWAVGADGIPVRNGDNVIEVDGDLHYLHDDGTETPFV